MSVMDYSGSLEAAAVTAAQALVSMSYADRISGKPQYSVMTVIPGAANVYLTREGRFLVDGIHKPLDSRQLLAHIADAARRQGGSTMPSTLPLDGLVQHLVHEIENVPKIARILKEEGSSSRLKDLLRV